MNNNRILFWTASIVVFAGIGLGAAGFAPNPAPAMPTEDGVLLVHSGETNGYLEPCGCFKPMIGGMLRRAGFLDGVKQRRLTVDNGDLTLADGRQAEIKAETIIEHYNHMRYGAINIGETDVKLGLNFLRSLQKASQAKFISANLVGADGSNVFDPYWIANRRFSANGEMTRMVVVGVLSDRYAANVKQADPTLTLRPVRESLARIAEEARSNGKFFVLLYHGPKNEAVELLKDYPWFNVVVYGHGADSAVPPERVGATWLVNAGQKGKYLGTVSLSQGTNGAITMAEPRAVTLTPDFPSTKVAEATRKTYQQRVRSEKLILTVSKTEHPTKSRFVGSAECASCHKDEHNIWIKTQHAGAMQTLVDDGHESDPDCVSCHVTGLEFTTGFKSLETTPKLKDVGCESCHGPGGDHIENSAKMPKIGEASCKSCHVPDHSPNFDYSKYWPKIAH